MPFQSSSESQNLIVTRFGDRVTSLTNDRAVGYNMIPISGQSFSGGDIVDAVVGSYPGSFRAVGPNPSQVPRPSVQGNQKTTTQRTYFLASYSVDWFVKLLTKDAPDGAFLKQQTLTLDRMTKYVIKNLERQTMGDGTGCLIPTTGSTGITNISTSPTVNQADWTFDCDAAHALKIEAGMEVEFWDGTKGATTTKDMTKRDVPSATGHYTVKGVTYSGTTATVTINEGSPGTNSPAANDAVFIAGAMIENATPSTTNAGRELLGLSLMCDEIGAEIALEADTYLSDHTYLGLSPANAATGFWRGMVHDANSEKLQDKHFKQLAKKMQKHGSTEPDEVSAYFAFPDRVADYEDSKTAQVRYTVSDNMSPAAPGGLASSNKETRQHIQYSGKDIIPSRFVLDTEVLAPNFSETERCELAGFQFRPEHDDYGGRPADQGDALAVMQLRTLNRPAHGKIKNLSNASNS